MSARQFQQAEEQFFLLKGQLSAGRITQEQFDAALKELMIQDAQGHYWMLGADTGKWHVHDGQRWLEASPPSGGGYFQTAPPRAPQRGVGLTALLAIGGIAGLCLFGIVALLFASSQGILKIGLVSPTNTPFPTFAPAISPVVSTPAASPTPVVIIVTPTSASLTATIAPTPTVTATLSAADLVTQADSLTLQSRLAEAAALYQRAVQMDASNALAYARWARLLDFQSYLEDRSELLLLAVSNAETAARLAPTNAEVQVRMARAYDWNGAADKALAAAQNAVQLAPNSAEAYAVLAEALLDSKKLADAEVAALRAVQLDPNSAEAHRSLGWVLYDKKQTEAGLAELDKAAQLEADLGVRHLELGAYHRILKDYAKAAAAYQKAIALYPQAVRAYASLGATFLDQKQYEQAIAAYTEVTRINAKSVVGYYGLGQAYYAAENCPQAIPAFQKTIELNPKANIAMTYLGWCEFKAGNLAAAADWAQKATAIDAKYQDTKDLLSAVATAQATPTPSIPPGLYVTGLRLEPPQPGRAQDVGFYVTFLNTTGAAQNYRWIVYIYSADNLTRSFGETSSILTSIPVGMGEQKALGTWRTSVGGCDNFIARVAWLDENKKATFFTRPDGQIFELAFSVC